MGPGFCFVALGLDKQRFEFAGLAVSKNVTWGEAACGYCAHSTLCRAQVAMISDDLAVIVAGNPRRPRGRRLSDMPGDIGSALVGSWRNTWAA